MNYTDAIEWLREHDVKKDDGSYYEFGEVMTEHKTQMKMNRDTDRAAYTSVADPLY